MEKTLTIKWGCSEISFSDLDQQNDIEIQMEDKDSELAIYANKENLIAIKEHMEYLISKF